MGTLIQADLTAVSWEPPHKRFTCSSFTPLPDNHLGYARPNKPKVGTSPFYPLPALSCVHGFAWRSCLPPGSGMLRQHCRSSNSFLKEPFLNASFGLFISWYYISYSHWAAVWGNVHRRTLLQANTNIGDADRWRNHTGLQEGRAE